VGLAQDHVRGLDRLVAEVRRQRRGELGERRRVLGAEGHAVAGEIDRTRPHPVAMAEAQTGQPAVRARRRYREVRLEGERVARRVGGSVHRSVEADGLPRARRGQAPPGPPGHRLLQVEPPLRGRRAVRRRRGHDRGLLGHGDDAGRIPLGEEVVRTRAPHQRLPPSGDVVVDVPAVAGREVVGIHVAHHVRLARLTLLEAHQVEVADDLGDVRQTAGPAEAGDRDAGGAQCRQGVPLRRPQAELVAVSPRAGDVVGELEGLDPAAVGIHVHNPIQGRVSEAQVAVRLLRVLAGRRWAQYRLEPVRRDRAPGAREVVGRPRELRRPRRHDRDPSLLRLRQHSRQRHPEVEDEADQALQEGMVASQRHAVVKVQGRLLEWGQRGLQR
jgi:hypothetical protein